MTVVSGVRIPGHAAGDERPRFVFSVDASKHANELRTFLLELTGRYLRGRQQIHAAIVALSSHGGGRRGVAKVGEHEEF